MCPKGSQDKGLKLLPETSLGAFYTVAMNNKTFSLKLSDTMNSKVVEHFNLATFYPTYKLYIFFGAIRKTCREERYII